MKEFKVVSNCPLAHLESVAEAIWVPLFQNSANTDESTRNVGAACLGKLATTNPSRYLPQLQVKSLKRNVSKAGIHAFHLGTYSRPRPGDSRNRLRCYTIHLHRLAELV